jgi:hypothetical protein
MKHQPQRAEIIGVALLCREAPDATHHGGDEIDPGDAKVPDGQQRLQRIEAFHHHHMVAGQQTDHCCLEGTVVIHGSGYELNVARPDAIFVSRGRHCLSIPGKIGDDQLGKTGAAT